MKTILSLLCCALFVCTTALSQKPPIKFGDIPMEDMKMTVYPRDSGAVAVVLADFGESGLVYNRSTNSFELRFERIRRIKILKREGLSYAEFSIPLWSESTGANQEKLTSVKATTYNLENGKIVETDVKKDSYFKEKYADNLTLHKGVFTNVKEGSIVELSYTVLSEFVFNFQDWEFQALIPVRSSEYRARIPEYFGYQKYMQGYVSLAVNETKPKDVELTIQSNSRIGLASISQRDQTREVQSQTLAYREDMSRWVAENVPAFKKEPYMTTVNDYISKINFELAYTQFPGSGIKPYMGTWDDINSMYWKEVNGHINAIVGLKDDVQKAIGEATTDEQKVQAIFNYVRRNTLWDGIERKFPDSNPAKTLETGKGSSAEINLALACLLDKVKIKAYPVLVSTRDHGFVRESFPVISQFNYVVCLVQVGDKTVLLDATDRVLPIGSLPERCLNGNGLLVTPAGSKWISLQPSIKTRTIYNADVAVAANGEVKGTLRIDKTGYHSAIARRQYHSKGEGEYVKELLKDPVWTYSNSAFENASDISLPFKETHNVVATEVTNTTPTTIYFNPIFINREDENPFKSEKREYPVDFGNQFEQVYTAKITIPEGYIVDELPPSKMFNLPENAARFVYSTGIQGNTINITSGLYINRSLYMPDVYPHLREFYNMVIAKQAEQVVLKKK